MPFAVAFPKYVLIMNKRLACTYVILVVFTLAIIVVQFWLTGRGYREVDVAPHVKASLWVHGWSNTSQLQAAADVSAGLPFCRTPELFEYKHRTNYSCLPLCSRMLVSGPSRVPVACLSGLETYVQEGQSQVMLVSEVEDTTDESTVFHFVPTVEALEVAFTYSFRVPRPSYIPGFDFSGDSHVEGSNRDIITVLLDHDGEVQRTWLPGEGMSLSVPELLALTNDAGMLDSLNHDANPGAGSAPAAPPLTRLTGAELTLRLSCYDHSFRGSPYVCYVEVRRSPRTWASAQQLLASVGGAGLRHRVVHGLRVGVEPAGFLRFADFSSIFTAFVDALVLLQVPKQIVLVFMVVCLGHLSRVYSRVLFEPFNLIDELGGMATRLMAQSAQYSQLEDQEPGISRECMEERFRLALSLHNLQEGELDTLVDVCFRSVVQRHALRSEYKDRLAHRSVSEKYGITSKHSSKLKIANVIDLETFAVACSCDDRLEFDTAVMLFDLDRHARRLEKLFMPKHLRRFVDSTKSLNLKSLSLQRPDVNAAAGPQSEGSNTELSTASVELQLEVAPSIALSVQSLQSQQSRETPSEQSRPTQRVTSPRELQRAAAEAGARADQVHSRLVTVEAGLRANEVRESRAAEQIVTLLKSFESRLASREEAASSCEERLAALSASTEDRLTKLALNLDNLVLRSELSLSILKVEAEVADKMSALRDENAALTRRFSEFELSLRAKILKMECFLADAFDGASREVSTYMDRGVPGEVDLASEAVTAALAGVAAHGEPQRPEHTSSAEGLLPRAQQRPVYTARAPKDRNWCITSFSPPIFSPARSRGDASPDDLQVPGDRSLHSTSPILSPRSPPQMPSVVLAPRSARSR